MSAEEKYRKNDRVWIACPTEDGGWRRRPATVIAYIKRLHDFYENENFAAIRYEDDEADKKSESRFECVSESRISPRQDND